MARDAPGHWERPGVADVIGRRAVFPARPLQTQPRPRWGCFLGDPGHARFVKISEVLATGRPNYAVKAGSPGTSDRRSEVANTWRGTLSSGLFSTLENRDPHHGSISICSPILPIEGSALPKQRRKR